MKSATELARRCAWCLLLAVPSAAAPAPQAEFQGFGERRIAFDEQGRVSGFTGRGRCTWDAALERDGLGFAALLPDGVRVESLALFAGEDLAAPLEVGGRRIAMHPDGAVADLAEQAAAGARPTPPGFRWVGFRSTGVPPPHDGAQSFAYAWAYSVSGYPEPKALGPHVAFFYFGAGSPSDYLIQYFEVHEEVSPRTEAWRQALVLSALVAALLLAVVWLLRRLTRTKAHSASAAGAP